VTTAGSTNAQLPGSSAALTKTFAASPSRATCRFTAGSSVAVMASRYDATSPRRYGRRCQRTSGSLAISGTAPGATTVTTAPAVPGGRARPDRGRGTRDRSQVQPALGLGATPPAAATVRRGLGARPAADRRVPVEVERVHEHVVLGDVGRVLGVGHVGDRVDL